MPAGLLRQNHITLAAQEKTMKPRKALQTQELEPATNRELQELKTLLKKLRRPPPAAIARVAKPSRR